MASRFLICWLSCITRRVPSRLMSTVGRSVCWKSNVAAEWITTFTLSINFWRSGVLRPRSSRPTSPVTALSLENTLLDFSSMRRSKIWNEKGLLNKCWKLFHHRLNENRLWRAVLLNHIAVENCVDHSFSSCKKLMSWYARDCMLCIGWIDVSLANVRFRKMRRNWKVMTWMIEDELP